MCGQILGKKDDIESFCRNKIINSQTDMGNIFQNIVAVTTVPSTPTPHVDDGGDLMLEATTDNVAVILLTMVALIMLLMMLAEYVDPSEILRSSKHHMVIIEG